MKIYVDTGLETFTQFFYQATGESFEFEISSSTYQKIGYNLITINYGETTSEELVLSQDPTTINEVEILKDSLNNEVIYLGVDGSTGILEQGSEGGPVYFHAFHNADQTFGVASTAQDVLFNTVSNSNGITIDLDKTITITEDGVYYLQAKGQARSSGGVNKDLKIWIQLNGTSIECTGADTTDDNNEGSVVTTEITRPFVDGDEIVIRAQVSNTDVFMDFVPATESYPCTGSASVNIHKI